ncbi:MAG: hypothetical protein U5K79_00710 [Cyclobacteriaceae bacterium]|nr:hypothetical protein [Cyclobacteriaceae bacterium]
MEIISHRWCKRDLTPGSAKRVITESGFITSHLLNGPVDKGNSGDGHTNLGIYGKSIGKTVSIDGNIGYDRDTYHFYGYEEGIEVRGDTIEQIFNTFRAGVSLANSQAETDIHYRALANFYRVNDKFDASESGIFGGVGAEYELDDAMRARLISICSSHFIAPMKKSTDHS